MPSEIMDQGRSPSLFSKEIGFMAERKIGFWKPEPVPDHAGTEGMPFMSEKRSTGKPMTSWRVGEQDFGLRSDLRVQPSSLFMDGSKVVSNGSHYENGLFSSSLSEIFDKKVKLSSNNVPLDQSINKVNSNFGEGGPFESFEEIEAKTIGNLLPDDDDLLSGVLGDLGYVAQPNTKDDIDDDIFSFGGGIELEADEDFSCNKTYDSGGGAVNEHPYGEHPSRTLFVRNINSNVEDSELKTLFEQYGDVRTLYTACKHRGFVMISYYDIRAARNAMRALQNKPLRRRKLDIHFSIPKDNPSDKDVNQGTLVIFNLDSSVSNDDILRIFGVYGEIKEIRETPNKHRHKFIEFYDVRAAEAALRALNRSDIAGKKIKIEASHPGGARRCLMQQLSSELELEESSGCRHESPNSSLGCFGSMPLGAITSNGLDNSIIQGPHSASRAPATPFMEAAFPGISSSSVLHTLSSPIRVASVGNHSNPSGHGELSHSLEQMKFGFQRMPNFLPHSLPDFHDSLQHSFYNSSTISAINSRANSSSLSNHAFERNEGALGLPGNGSCPLHGHQYLWNNASSYHHHSPGPMMWPNPPSFLNSVSPHPLPQMHGLPGPPSHMLNPVHPSPHHHVGSAPAMNPSLWDMRQAYPRDSTDAHAFHPGSLGRSIDPAHAGIPSPRQRCHHFHGRNAMVPSPASFEVSNDRIRTRRSDSSVSQVDNKRQYELDIERIINGEDSRTTLMIKNIPNKYTSKMLLAAIDEHNRGTYDFIYLPIDFKNKCNVGYAFINMIDPQQIIPFYQAFNGKKWEKFNSEKVATLTYARIQGKGALVAHFQNSSLMNEDKRCRPILFHSDGPNAGDQEPFPMGINIRSRPGRSRTAGYEESTNEEKPLLEGTNP